MSKGFKKRRLAVALGACLTMTSAAVQALGMGEIEVESALNEPLGAKIKLFSATPQELESLKVEMASGEVFSRMGIDRAPVLSNLRFELVSEGRGAPYIKVTSAGAVKEPFLDFILSVNWASGQMMREYTVLLDPPVFEPDQPVERVAAPATQPAQVVRESAPVASAPPRITPPGSYGPTARTDTLWAIARDMRPDGSITVPQMMIALLRENPEAFEDNNINNLRAGHVLRQPDMDMITALSGGEAAAEANRQFQEWRAVRQGAPAPEGRQQRVADSVPAAAGAAPVAAPGAAAQPETQARLQLLSPDEEALVRAGVGSGSSGEATDSLRQQLAIAQETAEATRQENTELRGRLEELERQLQSVQKLLTLRDDTMTALQSGTQQPSAEAPAAQPDAAAEAPAPLAAPQPEPQQATLLDELLANPTYLYAAGGGLVVLLLLVMLVMRRRRQGDEDFTVMTPVVGREEPEAAAGRNAVSAAAPAAAAVAAAGASAAAGQQDEPVGIADIGGGFGTIQAEESEIDPISEADVYLAYRRYEQAEALLKEAINADPERHELKLKLLEIYHATKDVESFEAQAESLYAAVGGSQPALWGQAVELGRDLLPDHPLFSEGDTGAAGEEVELGIESADDEDAFSFDDAPQALAGDDADLSDEDLAARLSEGDVFDVPSAEEAGAGDESIAEDLGLDQLGDLDLDLDLSEARDADKTGSEAGEFDLDIAAESLEGFGEVAEEFSEPDEGAIASTDAAEGLEVADEVVDQPGQEAPQKEELSLADNDGPLGGGDNPYANVDLEAFSSGESDSWDVEAAQSVFDARDVDSETDGLLDSARRKSQLESGTEMDASLESEALPEGVADEPSLADRKDAAEAEEEDVDLLAEMADLGEMDFSNMSDDDNDDVFSGSDDVVGTKLDLARAYIDMGDQEGARTILDEVAEEGDEDQRQEAQQLMQKIS